MRRATTPTHIFTFPDTVEVSSVTEILISYSQCGKVILEKTFNDLSIDTDKNAFYLDLTQDETDLFAPGKALIQVRAKTGNKTLASQMIWLTVKPVLNSEEM